jgi:hypothetical protein
VDPFVRADALRSLQASDMYPGMSARAERPYSTMSTSLRCERLDLARQLPGEVLLDERPEFALLDLALSPVPPSSADLSCALSADDLLTADVSSELSEQETQMLLQNGVAPWDNSPDVSRMILQRLRSQNLQCLVPPPIGKPLLPAISAPFCDVRQLQYRGLGNAPLCTASTSSSVTAPSSVPALGLRRNVSVSEMSPWDD